VSLVLRKLSFSLVVAAALVVCSVAFGDAPSPDNPAGRSNDVLGVVPVHSEAGKHSTSGSGLVYHGGPVMHTNATYAIYWIPSGYSVSAGYQSLLDRFLTDVAADSGKTSNVYYSDTQYSDNTNGSILYSSSFVRDITDSSSFPASGCRDAYTSVCLTDAQLQTEIDNVINANGLPRGTGAMYFIFTPKNVG